MDPHEHASLMGVLLPQIIEAIVRQTNFDYEEAIDKFYSSKLYELYCDEKTKLWHFSNSKIADMLVEELENGKIEFPEEG